MKTSKMKAGRSRKKGDRPATKKLLFRRIAKFQCLISFEQQLVPLPDEQWERGKGSN